MQIFILRTHVTNYYSTSNFNLQRKNLELAGELKFRLLSLEEIHGKMNIPTYRGMAKKTYNEYKIKIKDILSNSNIDAIKMLLKYEILNQDELKMNEIIEIIDKHNLEQDIKKTECLNDEECPVCLDIKDINKGYYNCNHSFCEPCYKGWSKNSDNCPMCRSD